MTWVLLFGGIALFAGAGAVGFAVWLWRRTRALLAELAVLSDRVDELARLADEIRVPEPGADRPAPAARALRTTDRPR